MLYRSVWYFSDNCFSFVCFLVGKFDIAILPFLNSRWRFQTFCYHFELVLKDTNNFRMLVLAWRIWKFEPRWLNSIRNTKTLIRTPSSPLSKISMLPTVILHSAFGVAQYIALESILIFDNLRELIFVGTNFRGFGQKSEIMFPFLLPKWPNREI